MGYASIGATLGLFILAACAQSGPVGLASLDAPSSCAADSWQVLVGQRASELDTTSLPQPMRLVDAGYDAGDPTPERMTVVSGGDGRVTEVVCN